MAENSIEARLQKAGLMRGGSAEASIAKRLNITTKKATKTVTKAVKRK
jgi:hypothetical protein